MKNVVVLVCVFLSLSASAQFNAGKYWDCGYIKAYDPDTVQWINGIKVIHKSEVIYSITAGNTASYFLIMPMSGVIKVDTAIYDTFKNYKTFKLTFTIKDPEGNYIKTIGSIRLYKDAGVKRKPTVIGL